MTIDNRIKKLSEVSGLSEKEIKSIIEKKKEDAAGLLTDHGAVYALEKEYGVNSEGAAKTEYSKISDLKPGLNNVNVVGVIKEIRPIKKFKTDKRSGQLARILLSDASGESNVVLWDKNAEIVHSDKIKPGSVLLIRNGYTRDSLGGGAEVHVGGLSRLVIDPKNVDKKILGKLPKVGEKVKKISELKPNDIATTQGRILYLYPKSEFDRSDGRKGYRSSAIIEDETGKLRVVLWDSNADRISDFNEGSVVRVEGGQVRDGNRGLEIHIGNRGRILSSDAKLKLPKIEAKTYKISEIEPNLQNVDLSGRVVRILPVKEFVSGDRTGKLASLILADDTGFSRAVLWGEKADLIRGINQGDIVLIKNGYTKQSMSGESEVHLSQRGSLQVNPENIEIPAVEMLIEKHAEEKSIKDMKPDDRNVRVTGEIEDIDENAIVFEICSECGLRLENVAGEWLCDVCGEAKPAYGMVISCGITDGTGDIRAVFYRDLAEELAGMSVADAMNLIGQSGDELEPVKQIRGEIAGNRISVVGNIRYNDYLDKLELMVSSISSVEKGKAKPKKKRNEKPPEPDEVPEEVLKDDDMQIEEINLDE
jgi:replication factor A1